MKYDYVVFYLYYGETIVQASNRYNYDGVFIEVSKKFITLIFN